MRTSSGQIPVGASSSSNFSTSVAVNGFVIDAIRKIVAGSQPTAAVTRGSPATE